MWQKIPQVQYISIGKAVMVKKTLGFQVTYMKSIIFQ